ncbi:hypothetical protein [Flavobacterium marginilacus]|uniref:hypothetical protein n=1 Tax=Flavobacterium marginilacus TaxID=3003256 RepID=UPI00248ECD2F|nr:hypothetical protein [Flavobacterium marginilacus]
MSKSFLNNPSKVRGLRNNNPGNLIRTSITWLGKVPFTQSEDPKFEQFTTLSYGLRAMLKDLINDINKGKNTVQLLIREYAPPIENDTNAYINSVSKTLGYKPTQKITSINANFMLRLVRAILKVELGQSNIEVADSDILEAISNLGEVSTSILKVDTNVSFFKKFMIPILLTVGLFFYTYATQILI